MATPRAPGPPGQPMVSHIGSRQLTLSWDPPRGTADPSALRYMVSVRRGGEGAFSVRLVNVQGTSIRVGVEPEMWYEYCIAAVDGTDCVGPLSEPSALVLTQDRRSRSRQRHSSKHLTRRQGGEGAASSTSDARCARTSSVGMLAVERPRVWSPNCPPACNDATAAATTTAAAVESDATDASDSEGAAPALPRIVRSASNERWQRGLREAGFELLSPIKQIEIRISMWETDFVAVAQRQPSVLERFEQVGGDLAALSTARAQARLEQRALDATSSFDVQDGIRGAYEPNVREALHRFVALDVGRSGRLSREEFASFVCEHADARLSEHLGGKAVATLDVAARRKLYEKKRIFEKADLNADGTIDLNEFFCYGWPEEATWASKGTLALRESASPRKELEEEPKPETERASIFEERDELLTRVGRLLRERQVDRKPLLAIAMAEAAARDEAGGVASAEDVAVDQREHEPSVRGLLYAAQASFRESRRGQQRAEAEARTVAVEAERAPAADLRAAGIGEYAALLAERAGGSLDGAVVGEPVAGAPLTPRTRLSLLRQFRQFDAERVGLLSFKAFCALGNSIAAAKQLQMTTINLMALFSDATRGANEINFNQFVVARANLIAYLDRLERIQHAEAAAATNPATPPATPASNAGVSVVGMPTYPSSDHAGWRSATETATKGNTVARGLLSHARVMLPVDDKQHGASTSDVRFKLGLGAMEVPGSLARKMPGSLARRMPGSPASRVPDSPASTATAGPAPPPPLMRRHSSLDKLRNIHVSPADLLSEI